MHEISAVRMTSRHKSNYAAMYSLRVFIDGEKKYSPPRGSMNFCVKTVFALGWFGLTPDI